MDSRGYFLVDSSFVVMPTPWIQFLLQFISGKKNSKIISPHFFVVCYVIYINFENNVLPMFSVLVKVKRRGTSYVSAP
jgi:sulfur relay (sulfurtransferase) DsrC/TusE family protein